MATILNERPRTCDRRGVWSCIRKVLGMVFFSHFTVVLECVVVLGDGIVQDVGRLWLRGCARI